MNLRALLVVSLLIVLFARSAIAGEVYLAMGTYGEASFADFALPDAVAVRLQVYRPSLLQADAVRRRMAQTLAIAAELEDARRQREKAHAETRAQAAQWAARRAPEYPQPEYRRVVSFGFPRRHMHSHAHPRGPRVPIMAKPVRSPSWSKPLRRSSGRPGR